MPLVLGAMLIFSAGRAFAATRSRSENRPTVVQIPVWVETQTPLKLASLHLVGSGSGVALTRLQPPASPTIIFVVLDLTSAVTEAAEVRDGLQSALKNLPPQTWVGLFGANDGLHVIQDPTQDHAVLQWEIQAMYPTGHPGLLDSVEQVEKIASRVQRKGKLKVAIIAITDSNIFGYRSDYGNQQVNSSDTHDLSRRFQGRDLESKIQRMDRRLLQDRVPLFVLQVKNYPDALNRIYNNGLQRFCDTLGGASWFVQSRAEIQSDVQAAFTRVKDFYLATLKTPPPGHEVDLSLSVAGVSLAPSDYRQRLVTTSSDH